MNHRKPITISKVEEATKVFLELHWDRERLSIVELPDMWAPYNFVGTVKYGDQQGCYALMKNHEVIYIGLGASRGGGIYEGAGIGARLNNHILSWDKTKPASIIERIYRPQERWTGITRIYTFGFPPGYGYLACSLEAYLISRLEPVDNITKTSNAKRI